MRTRLLVVTALVSSALGVAAAPASASCYPQKPSTCRTCRISDVSIGPNGVEIIWECP